MDFSLSTFMIQVGSLVLLVLIGLFLFRGIQSFKKLKQLDQRVTELEAKLEQKKK